MRSTALLIAALALGSLACAGLGVPGSGPGVPSSLRGQWYRDGKLLQVDAHQLGDWRARDDDLPGVFANDTFLFDRVQFRGRGSKGVCSGSLALKGGDLVVDLSGPCEELDGAWSRDPAGKKRTTSSARSAPAPAPSPRPVPVAPVTPAPQPVAIDECRRYIDCVCDIATRIQTRTGDASYESSCDVARLMVQLGTSQSDCRQALRDMTPWFDGIETAYRREGVVVPTDCRR